MLLLKLLVLIAACALCEAYLIWKKCDPKPPSFSKMKHATEKWLQLPPEFDGKAKQPEYTECTTSGSNKKCCFDPSRVCGKYQLHIHQMYGGVPRESSEQVDGFCRKDSDCFEKDEICAGFVCCYRHNDGAEKNKVCPQPSQKAEYLDVPCTDDKQCFNRGNFDDGGRNTWSFCAVILARVYRYYTVEFGEYRGCCHMRHEDTICPMNELPPYKLTNRFFVSPDGQKTECLDQGNTFVYQYKPKWLVCCPVLGAHFGPYAVPVEIGKHTKCTKDDDCGKSELSVCRELQRMDGQASPAYKPQFEFELRKACVRYPACDTGDDPEVNSRREMMLCKYGEFDPCYLTDRSKAGFCEKDYRCCPLRCPYYTGKNRHTGFKREFQYSFPDAKGQCHGDRMQLTDVPNQGKLCCKYDDTFDCPLNQSPALENLRKPTNRCPAESYRHKAGTHCCYYLNSKDLGIKARVADGDSKRTCKDHNECRHDEFCGQSTFAVHEDTFRGVVNHCYPKPTFDGGSPILLDKAGIRTCKTVSDCNGKDALVCEIPSFKMEGKTVSGDKKVCFQKPCPFGKQPYHPTKNCKDDKECGDGGCFKIIGSAKHCCPIPPSFSLCPPGEFPVAALDGTPHGACNETSSYQKTIDGRKYCCPKLHHAFYEPIHRDRLCDGNTCGKDHICTVSRRMDERPTRKHYKQCYARPKCNVKSNTGKFVSLRKGEAMECLKDDDCMFAGETPRFCGPVGLCCDMDCPYWHTVYSKRMEECPTGKCSMRPQACAEIVDGGKRCCLANGPPCPGDQVPVMYNFKAPEDKCPSGSSLLDAPGTQNTAKKMCCRDFKLKGGDDSIVPITPLRPCGKQSECNAGEFCGESEFIQDKDQMVGKPKFCYKLPEIAYGTIQVDSSGMKKCKKDKDCHGGVDGVVICIDPHKKNLYGTNLCFQKLCPFMLQPKDANTNCTNDSECPKGEICTLLGYYTYCCPTATGYLCPAEQLPISQTKNKCSSDYFLHPTMKSLCCPKFISKTTKKFAVDFKKECKKNSDCGPENFCGSSELFKAPKNLFMNKAVTGIRGSRMHCYPRPQYDGSFALADAAKTELITCKVPKDCKTKNPTICEKVEGISLCFEKSCPFGKLPKDPFVPCKDTAGCGNQGSCMKIFEGSKHCCPMEGAEKCANGEMPVLAKDSTIHGDCDTKTSESVKIGGKNFCCPKLVQRFTNQPPKKAKCSSTKKDCDSGDVCEEGKRLDGVARGSQTKQCYARPKCKSGKLALIREDEFLATCTEDKNCILQGDAPGYCEDGFCCPTLCPHWKKVTTDTFSPKACTGNDPKECGSDAQCTDLPDFGKTCCFVNTWRMCHTEDYKQLPILNKNKKTETDRDCASKAYPQKLYDEGKESICCYKMISKELSSAEKSVYPVEVSTGKPKECHTHGDCEKEKEFCGASELEFAKDTMRGTPLHCYKYPKYKDATPLLRTGSGVVTCNNDKDCLESTNPTVCVQVEKMKKICFERPCPFGKPATTLTTCQYNQNCAGEVCVHVLGDPKDKHCCPVVDEYRCHSTQLPVVKPDGQKCEAGSKEFTKFPNLCCINIVYKYWRELPRLNSDEECNNHANCPDDYFCGESTLAIHEVLLQGEPKHCYKKPSILLDGYDNLALPGPNGKNLATCQDSSECKSTHPTACETPIYNSNPNPASPAKMCFEKKCPYGELTSTTPKTCTDHSGCPGELCTAVFPGKKHCCPVSGSLKCHASQLPYIQDKWKMGDACKDGSFADKVTKLCCQKFIYKPFGETAPLTASGEARECQTHTDCYDGEFCGESTLSKMMSQLIGSPRHCFKKPVFKSVQAMTKKEHGLVECNTVTDCPATEPAVCEAMHGSKLCFQKPCTYGIPTQEPTKLCSNHDECSNSLCIGVFDHVKHCCPPDNALRCYGTQLPFIKADDPKKCSQDHVNGMCCQDFIYKDFGSDVPLKTNSKNRECSNHDECQRERGQMNKHNLFCGSSTLIHMEKRLQGTPRHCYAIPMYTNLQPLMKKNFDLVLCDKIDNCASTATDAVVCVESDDGISSTKKLCYQNKCPFEQPSNEPTKTCLKHSDCQSSLCVSVHKSTKLKHCCPVADKLKCHGTQLFYMKDGTDNCEDGSIAHPTLKKRCCQHFIYKGFGESNPLYAIDDGKECRTHSDCGEGQFCGESTLFKMGELLIGKPKHCYIKPEFEGQKAMVSDGHGLKSCSSVTECVTKNPVVCETGISNGKPVNKFCFEKVCPFGAPSQKTDPCSDHASCKNSVCVGLFSTQKFCCPVGGDFFCHKTQFPYIKDGAKGCEDGSEKHPKHPDICCQKFLYKLFAPDTVLHPIVEKNVYKECAKGSECGADGFCGASVLSQMATQGSPKHCYPRPILNTHPASMSNDGELVVCTDAMKCPGDKIPACEEPMIANSPLKNKKICYEGPCPLSQKPIDRKDVKTCTGETCGEGTHCINVFNKEKHCCKISEEKLCPGDNEPLLDAQHKVLKNCDKAIQYAHEVKKEQFCCDTPISKQFHAVGTVVQASDNKKTCTRNVECPFGTFCGESLIKGTKKAFDKPVKHCYQEPSGDGGISRDYDGSDIVVCEKHEECNAKNGEYCNTELGYTKGICHIARCPLTIATGEYKKCTSNDECGSEYCHPISSKDSGCCSIDSGNLCPGGLVSALARVKECTNKGHFLHQINGVDVCCRHLNSKIMKTAGTDWLLSKTPEEIAGFMDSKKCSPGNSDGVCGSGTFCDESVAMDGSSLEIQLNHCYPVPLVHGVTISGPPISLKTCKSSGECDMGEICDLKLHELDATVSQGTGVCTLFKCPLSPATNVARSNASTVTGSDLCDRHLDCGADTECHSVGIGGKFKGCCGSDQEFRCPGGIIPRKYNKKLIALDGSIQCEPGKEVGYMFGQTETPPSDDARCCPVVVSRDFYLGRYSGNQGDKVEPTDPLTACQKQDECKQGFFCGESMLLENFENGRELTVDGKSVHHCYPIPKCSGTAVRGGVFGLSTCTQGKEDSCGKHEACDFNLGPLNDNKYSNTGICCSFTCSGSAPESKKGGSWKAGKICDNCQNENADQAYCDSTIKNDNTKIQICEKTSVENQYRLCEYERDPVTCPIGLDSVLRNKESHELIGCKIDFDCRDPGRKVLPDARPRCVEPSRPLPEFPKVCCTADLCSDMFTDRENQPVCPAQNQDCSGDEEVYSSLKGQCEGRYDDNSTTSSSSLHCCPKGSVDEVTFDSYAPFLTDMPCSSLEDCIGEKRFCDPFTNKCMYYGNSFHSRQGSCTEKDTHCGADNRTICMKVLSVISNTEPSCYAHPFDECAANKDCGQSKYCAPAVGTNDSDWSTAFRKCHPQPDKAFRDDNEIGLKPCKANMECATKSCDTSVPNLAIQAGYGFCKHAIQISCRGTTVPKFEGGNEIFCSLNSQCGENEFCDTDLERHSAIPKGHGVCCTMPKCGGTAVKNETGLKLCRDDDGCDIGNGEICHLDILKPQKKNNWKEGEGVCCKMDCPRFEHKEATDPLPAGPKCSLESDQCKTDAEAFKQCVEAPHNVSYNRCCTYKRNPSLCPAESKGVVRDGLDAKECKAKDECPTTASCTNGWCCEQNFCSDKATLRNLQPQCGEKTKEKDCKQPKGAETSCEEGHCCPKVEKGVVSKPFVTDKPCKSALDCQPLMYCHQKHNKCTFFGSRKDLQTNKPCAKKDSKTCENGGVCVFSDEKKNSPPLCWKDPIEANQQTIPTAQPQIGEKDEDEGRSNTGVVLGVVAIVLALVGAVAVGIYIFCKYKASKKDGKDKKKGGKKDEKKDGKKGKKEKETKKKDKKKDKKKQKKGNEDSEASQQQSVSMVSVKDSQISVVDSEISVVSEQQSVR